MKFENIPVNARYKHGGSPNILLYLYRRDDVGLIKTSNYIVQKLNSFYKKDTNIILNNMTEKSSFLSKSAECIIFYQVFFFHPKSAHAQLYGKYIFFYHRAQRLWLREKALRHALHRGRRVRWWITAGRRLMSSEDIRRGSSSPSARPQAPKLSFFDKAACTIYPVFSPFWPFLHLEHKVRVQNNYYGAYKIFFASHYILN